MTKTKIIGVRFSPKAMAVLQFQADRAKRTISDIIRIVLEEKWPLMNEKRRAK